MIVESRTSWGGPSAAIGSYFGGVMLAVTAHNSYKPALPASATVAQERAAMQQMQRSHAAKWAGIGYHFAISQSGRVYECRGWNRVGAHAGSNTGNRTLGVVFVIDGQVTAPSVAALEKFAELRDEGVRLGKLSRGHTLKLHRDWKATICPGEKVAQALTRTPVSHRVDGAVFRLGDRGPLVGHLQDLLVVSGYMTAQEKATGPDIFGPRTDRAFKTFLAAHS